MGSLKLMLACWLLPSASFYAWPVPSPTPGLQRVCDSANEAFEKGTYSDNLTKAGLLLHQWDFQDPNNPWNSCGPVNTSSWPDWTKAKNRTVPCPYADHISGSLVNANVSIQIGTKPATGQPVEEGVINLFSFPAWATPSNFTPGGIIISPNIPKLVMCAYASDGGTMTRRDHGCGCHKETANGSVTPKTCNNSCEFAHPVFPHGQCAYPPRQTAGVLKEMYRFHYLYNEYLLDPTVWVQGLPDTIVAFWYPTGTDQCKGECIKQTETAHAKFLKKFPEAKHSVPLLRLDVHGGKRPFTLAPAPAPAR